MPPVSATLARELTENTAWLRRLATSLVGSAEADDLVQETMEAALRQPPAEDRPVKPWLRTVLNNAAKMHWRSSGRRRARESQAQSLEALESADASLVRLELQHEVTEAVIALDEPYRTVIILRFVEGLTASAIAAKLDIPAGTVRSQIKRGLERLREHMDRKSKASDWRAALVVPFFVQPRVAMVAPGLLGGIIMKLGMFVVAAVAALLVAVTHGSESESSQASPASVSQERRSSEADPPLPAPPANTYETRRFADQAARQRFAAALAKARGQTRSEALDRQTKTYDFAGLRVDETRPTAPPTSDDIGKFDKDYIRKRLVEIVPLVKECYDLALVSDPHLSGTLNLDFVIDAEEDVGGYVREAVIADDSPLQDAALSECVTETVLSIEFPAPEGGGVVRVVFPFVFGQTEE